MLFYPVPLDTPYLGFPTIFNVRIWQNREFKGRTPLGTDPNFYRKVLGRFVGPAPHAPQGSPDQWLNGFSYADWIAGKLGGSNCCNLILPQGGIELGGSWLNQRWNGGVAIGGTWKVAASWAGGLDLGGSWPAGRATAVSWAGGLAIGGSWPAGSSTAVSWAGGLAIGGSWPAGSSTAVVWAGGLALGGSWPAGRATAVSWAGGLAIGGSWPAGSSTAVSWAGGLAIGGSWGVDWIATACCPDAIPLSLTGVVTNISMASPPVNFSLLWTPPGNSWKQGSPKWFLVCGAGPAWVLTPPASFTVAGQTTVCSPLALTFTLSDGSGGTCTVVIAP